MGSISCTVIKSSERRCTLCDRSTGMAAVLTTLTTSVGFASLLTANVFGLNALGLLTIIGISMALLTTLVVLPAALQWREDRVSKSVTKS